MIENTINELVRDPRVTLTSGEESLAIDGGLQPFTVLTAKGTMLTQVQMPEESMPSERIRFQ